MHSVVAEADVKYDLLMTNPPKHLLHLITSEQAGMLHEFATCNAPLRVALLSLS